MKDIALVTASFGGVDRIRVIPSHGRVDAFYYTDQDAAAVEGWSSVSVVDYPSQNFHPRMRAKYFKLQPHRLVHTSGYDWLVWADASFSFKSVDFLIETAGRLGKLDVWKRASFIPHPHRKSVRQEYEFIRDSINYGNGYLSSRYSADNMLGQINAIGTIADDNILLCGGLWMVENSPVFHKFLNDWWDQVVRYSIMDQLSLPYALKLNGIEPQEMGMSLYQTDYFSIGHG